ncbi:hypothetical protein YC2023_048671 [Brassica napus]
MDLQRPSKPPSTLTYKFRHQYDKTKIQYNSKVHGPKSTSIGGSWVKFTHFPRKKYIIICYSNDPVSPRSFRMNPSRHCSVGPTPHGGPLLVLGCDTQLIRNRSASTTKKHGHNYYKISR